LRIERIEDFKIWLCYTGIELDIKHTKSFLDYIMGLRNEIQLIQAVDANKIFGSIHLKSAIYRTYRALMNKKNIARNISLELLLRLSGRRQIHEAIDLLGVKEDTKNIILICSDENLDKIKSILNELFLKFNIKENENLLEIKEDSRKKIIKETYGLKTNEILKELLMKIAYIELME